MFSANGRLKPNKVTASKETTEQTICLDCGNVMPRMNKIFGEHIRCDKCDSTNIEVKIGK